MDRTHGHVTVPETHDTKTLRSRVLHSGIWTVGGYGAEMALRLFSTVLMTRLLVPSDFGVVAVAMTVPTTLELLSDIGIRSNVIRKAGDMPTEFVLTAWTLQLTRSVALWVLSMIVVAALIVLQHYEVFEAPSIYADPKLPWLLTLANAVLLMNGITSINIFLRQRAIDVRPLVTRNILSKLVTLGVMLCWAYYSPTAYALMMGVVTGSIFMAVSSHFLIPGAKMRWLWDPVHARELLARTRWLALSTAVGLVLVQGDRIILGFLGSASEVGLYSIAKGLVEAAQGLPKLLQQRLTLPVLSEVHRTRPHDARRAYYRFRQPFDAFVFSLAGILAVCGQTIVDILYDPRYTASGPILQILALSMIALPFGMINMSFLSTGRFRAFALNTVALSFGFIAASLIGFWFAGWMGAIWGLALYAWPANLLLLARARLHGWISFRREISMLPFLPLGAAAGYGINWLLSLLPYIK